MGTRANGIEKATGVSWAEWTEWLTGQGAVDREHPDIARLAEDRLIELGITSHAATGAPLNIGWWAQGIAIDFGQDHGLRLAGQTSRGDFSVAVTKTLPGTIDEALETWLAVAAGLTTVAGVELSAAPKSTRTEKWRYWRVGLADGSRVSVGISAGKVPDGAAPKALLAVSHGGLESPEGGEPVRAWWKDLLATAMAGPHRGRP